MASKQRNVKKTVKAVAKRLKKRAPLLDSAKIKTAIGAGAFPRGKKKAEKKKKMACGGRVKKQTGGLVGAAKREKARRAGTTVKPAGSGKGASKGSVKNMITALMKHGMSQAQAAKKKMAADKARGITYSKPAPGRTPQQRTRNGTIQVKGADGIWRNKGRKKKN